MESFGFIFGFKRFKEVEHRQDIKRSLNSGRGKNLKDEADKRNKLAKVKAQRKPIILKYDIEQLKMV